MVEFVFTAIRQFCFYLGIIKWFVAFEPLKVHVVIIWVAYICTDFNFMNSYTFSNVILNLRIKSHINYTLAYGEEKGIILF